MTYREVAEKYGTDKASHGYMEFYEKMIPAAPKKMLEIGVFKGASIKTWKELFPTTELHVIDLFRDPDNLTEEQAQQLGAITHRGDQGDREFLNTIPGDFDVIIDDGSHNAHHQWISLEILFGKLRSLGMYFVEDLHCNCDPFYYDRKMVRSYSQTIHRAGIAGMPLVPTAVLKDQVFAAGHKIVCITKC